MWRSVPLVLLCFASASAFQVSTPIIDGVEEDWEIVIKTTDVTAAGPQITTTMCPGPVEDHPDANFNLNYREGESFLAGGLQIEVFDGDQVLTTADARTESLQTDNETITWTQRLSVSDSTAYYLVKSGLSTTWGSFGGTELSVSFPTTLTDMSNYTPDVSTANSGVGWQSDHVSSMQLLQVRYYSGNTLVSTDSTPRTILPAVTP